MQYRDIWLKTYSESHESDSSDQWGKISSHKKPQQRVDNQYYTGKLNKVLNDLFIASDDNAAALINPV